MMAQAGAILMSLGRKPGTQGGNSQKEWNRDTLLEIIRMSQEIDLPANSPVKPSWATMRLITLKVDEETSVETEKEKKRAVRIRWPLKGEM